MPTGEIKTLVFADGISVTAPAASAASRVRIVDSTGWNGSVATVTYDVSAYTDDATKLVWTLKDSANNSLQVEGIDIDCPSATQVRVTVGTDFKLNGTFVLVGV